MDLGKELERFQGILEGLNKINSTFKLSIQRLENYSGYSVNTLNVYLRGNYGIIDFVEVSDDLNFPTIVLRKYEVEGCDGLCYDYFEPHTQIEKRCGIDYLDEKLGIRIPEEMIMRSEENQIERDIYKLKDHILKGVKGEIRRTKAEIELTKESLKKLKPLESKYLNRSF